MRQLFVTPPCRPGPANGAQSKPWRRRSGWLVSPVNVRDAGEIERDVAAFAQGSNSGLIVTVERVGRSRHRDLIVTLAARHRLPAIYLPTRTSSPAVG